MDELRGDLVWAHCGFVVPFDDHSATFHPAVHFESDLHRLVFGVRVFPVLMGNPSGRAAGDGSLDLCDHWHSTLYFRQALHGGPPLCLESVVVDGTISHVIWLEGCLPPLSVEPGQRFMSFMP